MSPSRLLAELRRELRRVADGRAAPAMQAYMRSAMPFLGVHAPAVRAIARARISALRFRNGADWSGAVRHLWTHARFREERYLAIALARAPAARAFQTPEALGLYEEMIRTGAWWDYVDEIAVHCVGDLLRSSPGPVARTMRRWSRSDDLWLRRTAILSQVASKRGTDTRLLSEVIEPSLGSSEFFLRKAIGWALRQYARDDPDWVRSYVRSHVDRLSPLSRREAMRHLDPGRA